MLQCKVRREVYGMLQSFCITISLLGRRGGNNCYERVSSLVEPYKNMFSKIYPTLLPNTCGPKGPFFNMEGLKLLLSFGVERRWHCRIKIGLSHAPIHSAKKKNLHNGDRDTSKYDSLYSIPPFSQALFEYYTTT